MNISLSEGLKAFVDERVSDGAYSTSSEYVRELIRKDRDRERLRALLLEGATSPMIEMNDAFFDELRAGLLKPK